MYEVKNSKKFGSPKYSFMDIFYFTIHPLQVLDGANAAFLPHDEKMEIVEKVKTILNALD